MQAVILSERALADTDEPLRRGGGHVARKLGRVKPLDAEHAAARRAHDVTALDAVGRRDVGNWRGELARYYEDHIPLRLRPDPALNAALRRLQAAGVGSRAGRRAPTRRPAIVVHHLGLGRRIERIASADRPTSPCRLADELAASRDQALVVAEDAGALAAAVERGIGAAAARWAGAGQEIARPVTALATPNDLVALVLGETAAAR